MGRMRGTYCEHRLNSKAAFDKRSFRWKRSKTSWVLVACPKRAWSSAKKRCKRGLKGVVLLADRKARKRCPKGTKLVRKS